ncbi:Aste57867_16047 [Aphanomyces stellatus]|uniref:Mannosyl-oligosaccharide glucosidase n=1 Tax=Aphanomyces stellatus TaxID=120398 RepID=A0A485L6F8_9STRA|nr:hypothetical protein As57867_015991 [Aphanomyces stellatus]VFT92831.1 Aste57867_16047 [Aphanomyces stellatus]
MKGGGVLGGALLLALLLSTQAPVHAHAAVTPSTDVDDVLRWGTYHSGLYFGIRSRTHPFHVSAGLLWSTTRDPISHLRHQCLESDHLEQYGWQQHDGRTFGAQAIRDQHNNLLLDTTFLKPPTSATTFATHAWAARIAASPLRSESPTDPTSLFLYFDLGCQDDAIDHPCRRAIQADTTWHVRGARTCRQPVAEKSCVEMELISRNPSNPLLSFHAHIQVHFKGAAETVDFRYHGADASWGVANVKEKLVAYAASASVSVSGQTGQDAQPRDVFLSNAIADGSSMALVQVRFDPAAASDVTLHVLYDEQEADETTTPVVVFDDVLPSLRARFRDKFEAAFPITTDDADDEDDATARVALAEAALSNLIGGIGYFYGRCVDLFPDKHADGVVMQTSAAPLYSGVPSRSFFPRGFLWDEGFHQLGVVAFDKDITTQVLDHWLNLMDDDGYISREQIRGELAEARVPAEFVTQYTTHANPPTLLLALEKLVPVVDPSILHAWWPKLKLHFQWYQTTQEGPEPNSFRWRGRDANDGKLMPNTLSSGLDDYPRASHPSDEERHVDLAAWMIKGSMILAEVAMAVGDTAAAANYKSLAAAYLTAMDTYHWDNQDGLYYDYGRHSADGEFEDHLVIMCQNNRGQSMQTTANVDVLRKARDDGCPVTHPRFLYPLGDGAGGLLSKQVFVPHNEALQFVKRVGYVSFFPLFLQLLQPDSPILRPLLANLVRHLLSPHGLLSLSPSDLYFERPNAPGDAPYWRGPIWININYLAIKSFHHYAAHATDAATRAHFAAAYDQLRHGVVASITHEYATTGYLYEQYNQRTGQGQRCHPFTGWTALIVNILAEKY